MPLQVPPDKTPGKIELTGRGNQISAVVRELLAGTYGVVPKDRGAGRSDFFKCLVRWDGGGSAGTDVVNASWTYDLWDFDADPDVNDPIAEGLQPHIRNSGPKDVAEDDTIGQYYFDADGEIALYIVNETDPLQPCTP